MTPDPTTRDPAASLRACIGLAAKATPGEWSQSHRKVNDGYSTQVYDVRGAAIATLAWHALPTQIEDGRAVTRTDRTENAEAICAAVNFLRDDAPALLAEVAEARRAAGLTASPEVSLADGIKSIRDGWTSATTQALENGQAPNILRDQLREAVALLRKIRPALACEDTYNPCSDLRAAIDKFTAHHGARTGDANESG